MDKRKPTGHGALHVQRDGAWRRLLVAAWRFHNPFSLCVALCTAPAEPRRRCFVYGARQAPPRRPVGELGAPYEFLCRKVKNRHSRGSPRRFYSPLRRPSYRVANGFCHCALRRLTPFFFLSFKFLSLRAPDVRVSAWKVRADRPVTSPWPESVLSFRRRALQLRGSSPPVHSTMLVSSSRRPAPVNRLPLPRAPCYAHKKN